MQDKYKREKFINESEKFITYLCDQAFMKLWVYPNVYYETGKEFCDCLIIFENNILIFSVKDYKYSGKTQDIAWKRWKHKTVDGCIKQIDGAEKWLLNHPNDLYIDSKCKHKLPIKFDNKNIKIYRFIVELGFHQDIGILYSDKSTEVDKSIGICKLPRNKIYHILDSINYELIFSELNTISNFIDFYKEKENIISKLETFGYYGESTLLALYYEKMDKTEKHRILPENFSEKELIIQDDLWKNVIKNPQYFIRCKENENSYIVDQLINKSIFYEQYNRLIGNIDVQNEDSAIKEFAKLTRFQRRVIGDTIFELYKKAFNLQFCERYARYMLEDDHTAFVFIVVLYDNKSEETSFRESLRNMLDVACGSLKNKISTLEKIVGLAFIPNELDFSLGEDYILLKCEDWNENDIKYYEEQNQYYRFWKQKIQPQIKSYDEFPKA